MHDHGLVPEPDAQALEWELELPEHGLRRTRVGAHAGAQHLGAAVYELAPGGIGSPYHLHHSNEELLIVLSGTPELRTSAGVQTLSPGAVVAFPRGPDGAHQLRNRSADFCRYVVVSEMRLPEVAEYPDVGATLIRTDKVQAFDATGELDSREVVQEALRASQDDRRSRAEPGRP